MPTATQIKDSNGPGRAQNGDPTKPDILIALMGPTGTGKSSFIQLITDDASINIGHSVQSATTDIGQYNYFDQDGRCVTLVDTPGFDDSRPDITDTDVLKKIATDLEAQFKEGKKLSGILYLHRITDPRMGGIANRNLRLFRGLCGDNALKNVVVMTTRWDEVPEKDGKAMEKREIELMTTKDQFFQPLISKGGRFLRHHNTKSSALGIIGTFMKQDPVPLQIQLEMRDGKTLEETAAGAELAAEMKILIAKHSSEMKNLKEEMEEAIAAKDRELKEELEAERTKMEKQMKRWEEQRQELMTSLRAEKKDALKRQQEADQKLHAQRVEMQRRMKKAKEEMEAEQQRLREELDNLSHQSAQAERKIVKLERSKVKAIKNNEAREAEIQEQIDALRQGKDKADRNHQKVLRSMCAQVCHWEPVIGIFTFLSFVNPVPIETGYPLVAVGRYSKRFDDGAFQPVGIQGIPEGDILFPRTYDFDRGTSISWTVEVLVGNPSRVTWVQCHGHFRVKSLHLNPVRGWDKERDGTLMTEYIGRFVFAGNIYVVPVKEGDNGVSEYINGVRVKSENYEVLCYTDV